MNENGTNQENNGFLFQLQMRAQQKAQEYADLIHQRQRLDMQIERTKQYVQELNNFLRREGQQTVPIKSAAHLESTVGKPGNRSKAMPLRRMEWDGMTVNQIITSILNRTPDASYHPSNVVSLIYEIESDADLKMVIKNIRSTMQRGAREGLWERSDRAQYKAKSTERQGILANT